jgi:hypothetical protein
MGLKGWCGSCDESSHEALMDSKLAEVRSYHQAKHVDKTMSHPHIASASCRRCIKEAQGIGCGEGGRWTVKSVAPRGGRCDDVDGMVSNKHIVNWSVGNRSPYCFCTLLSRAQPRCACK